MQKKKIRVLIRELSFYDRVFIKKILSIVRQKLITMYK